MVEPISGGVRALVLYGSHARGDSDSKSDVDICAFTTDREHLPPTVLEDLLPKFRGASFSLTIYSEVDLAAMLEYGSLFLWHLKLEGAVVYGREYFDSQLTRLMPFTKHHAEILYHRQIFDDSFGLGVELMPPNEFDLALLFTIARNSCMVLSHKAGRPTFGRLSCYHAAASEHHDLPLNEETYLFLNQWKLVYERGVDTDKNLPSSQEMKRLREIVGRLLEFADAHTQ